MTAMFHQRLISRTVGILLASGVIGAGAAPAQLAAANNLATVRTNQSLVGATVGNGKVQGQPVVDVQSKGRPAVGVGALSGKVDHFGSAGTVSVANNARLLGVDGAGGVNSPNSVSIRNPKQAPILSSPGR